MDTKRRKTRKSLLSLSRNVRVRLPIHHQNDTAGRVIEFAYFNFLTVCKKKKTLNDPVRAHATTVKLPTRNGDVSNVVQDSIQLNVFCLAWACLKLCKLEEN